jgi:RHS repeat-associated protein
MIADRACPVSLLYNQQVGFTGRYLDTESGLYYFRARYYSGTLGRFIGRDPIEYVDGNSLYSAYFIPNQTDPTGMFSFSFPTGCKFDVTLVPPVGVAIIKKPWLVPAGQVTGAAQEEVAKQFPISGGDLDLIECECDSKEDKTILDTNMTLGPIRVTQSILLGDITVDVTITVHVVVVCRICTWDI